MVLWLQHMGSIGCPKCKQKTDFSIKIVTPLDKSPNFLNLHELIDMQPGS